MYQPNLYKNDNHHFHLEFIKKHPFATVVINGDHLLATHIPILVKELESDYRLFGHIANHNPMLPFLKNGTEMLLIFNGPHAYVSSSWYEKPDISTWDYSAVHVRAKVTLQKDDELEKSLETLIYSFEKDQQKPLLKQDIPKDIWEENFKEITGFWLDPLEMLGISKWHQGFSENDRKNIAKNLRGEDTCPSEEIKSIIKNIYDSGD